MRVGISIAFALIASLAAQSDTVTIRGEAQVRGPHLRLADIAEISGEHSAALGAIEVGSAAVPGATKRLSASFVESRVRDSGYAPAAVAVRGAPQVDATTMDLDLTSAMLAEDLREYIRREMPWKVDAATVDITAPSSGCQVSDGEVKIVWRKDPQYEYLGAGVFRGEVRVDGRVERTVFARANIAAYDSVVVAAQPIARGELIGTHNTRLEKRELSALEPGAFLKLDDVAGRLARSTLLPGQVLSARKVELRPLVKRNELVAVESRVGNLVVRGQAKALSDAAEGATVTCANLNSNLKFNGVMRADGVVVVK